MVEDKQNEHQLKHSGSKQPFSQNCKYDNNYFRQQLRIQLSLLVLKPFGASTNTLESFQKLTIFIMSYNTSYFLHTSLSGLYVSNYHQGKFLDKRSKNLLANLLQSSGTLPVFLFFFSFSLAKKLYFSVQLQLPRQVVISSCMVFVVFGFLGQLAFSCMPFCSK